MTEQQKCETYFDIAKQSGLTGKTAERYVLYMTKRWKSNELVNCLCGYALEWAQGFLMVENMNVLIYMV